MKNFAFTAVAVSILAIAMIANNIRINRQVRELEQTLQQTYVELQELRYETGECRECRDTTLIVQK